VTTSKEAIGYTPPDDVKRIIESSGVKFTFTTLLVKKFGIRGSFVVGGSVDSEKATPKVSRNDHEFNIFKDLYRLGTPNIPEIISNESLYKNRYALGFQ